MRTRIIVTGVMVAAVTLGIATGVPGQTPSRRVIDISMVSYKFEPNQIRITEGETVVIRLKNNDQSGRRHNFASAYLLNVPITVRGDGEEGTSDGRRFVSVQAGKQAELEFVVRNSGSYPFLCTVFNHASLGQTGTLVVAASGQ